MEEEFDVQPLVENVQPLLGEKRPNTLRIVCISDTHSFHRRMVHSIPSGDILIHAGDMSSTGEPHEIMSLMRSFSRMPHPVKIVVGGNHDVTLDQEFYSLNWEKFHRMQFDADALKRRMAKHCVYLQDEMVIVNGLRIYGSPWQPEFYEWGFNLPRGKALKEKWDMIPEDIDVLITHSPPAFYGDFIREKGVHVGCADLLRAVQRVRPRLHVFGHVHEGHGIYTDHETTFMNCAVCTDHYEPSNQPLVFDIPRPVGEEDSGYIDVKRLRKTESPVESKTAVTASAVEPPLPAPPIAIAEPPEEAVKPVPPPSIETFKVVGFDLSKIATDETLKKKLRMELLKRKRDILIRKRESATAAKGMSRASSLGPLDMSRASSFGALVRANSFGPTMTEK